MGQLCFTCSNVSHSLTGKKETIFLCRLKRRITLGEKKSNFGSVFYVPFYVCNVKYKLNDPE